MKILDPIWCKVTDWGLPKPDIVISTADTRPMYIKESNTHTFEAEEIRTDAIEFILFMIHKARNGDALGVI